MHFKQEINHHGLIKMFVTSQIENDYFGLLIYPLYNARIICY